ncbi:MAG: hypothetical protein H6683_09620 [Deltaproteobacteria bacterium]|nr:hypothetical protein [Deltaproteobacteria bacterium]
MTHSSRAVRGIFSLFFAAAIALAASSARAQETRIPQTGDTPLGYGAEGFFQLQLGINSAPILDIEESSKDDNVIVNVDSVSINPVGFGAGLAFVPTWGRNGLLLMLSYDLIAARFDQTVDDNSIQAYTGDSTLGVSALATRAGYIRYFGDDEWHPWILADAGFVWETATVKTDYDGADNESGSDQQYSAVLGAGVGLGKEYATGLVGAELRVDFDPVVNKFEFDNPAGKYEIEINHPLLIKLNAVFALGNLGS